ncbi:selenide, water dikinase SelD [Paracoccus sp. Z330]|uniref:Selenide, water dikinase SelD n=1 Tax=Paracoccus onchidii TaxID=3017813 RepID=A0ABT4ZFL5_9RHOB|nr:selenide, water dikinase SelD [Paracoccus onchidii]MDB6178092.1 selenide, water dikinase SelD [Paracoccus onchidii]
MQPDIAVSRDLVLVGGGHTHALLLRKWGMRPLAGARLTLINPNPVAEYSGMLPGFIAGHYCRDEISIDLVKLCRHAGARLILDRATGMDRESRMITLAGRGPVAYDLMSIDIGVSSATDAIPGFARYAVPVKPTDRFVEVWQRFRDAGGGRILVIGAGLAGGEIALAARRALPNVPIHVIEAQQMPLREVSARSRRLIRARMQAADIRLSCGAAVVAVTQGGVELADGTRHKADLVIGAGGGSVAGWLGQQGLLMQGDRVATDARLVSSDPAIHAVGDCAVLRTAPRPQAGVFAVRQAPVLFHNLRNALMDRPARRRFRPQRDWLRLIAAGGDAVADKWRLGMQGDWIWRWKDRIDQRFMARLHDLPDMPAPALPRRLAAGARDAMGEKPLCGGCGAKMGRAALRQVLARQPDVARADILTGPGDDAAVIEMGGTRQVLTTDHLRSFLSDPALMARIAALHALGDIRAMGARPQSSLIQVTLPRMSEQLQARSLAEIMEAAGKVLARAGAPIIGGHSSVGAELTIGFSVTGLVDEPIGQAACPGDVLVLTKPIGSGVIMAAEMQKRAAGAHVGRAWRVMAQDQGRLAAILAGSGEGGARAMTDLTGFGLAGHLAGMAEQSTATLRVQLGALPILDGAEELARQGIRSSLYAANRSAVIAMVTTPDTPRGQLVFDPQTSGGLLAALPASQAGQLMRACRDAGEEIWEIGCVQKGPAQVIFE